MADSVVTALGYPNQGFMREAIEAGEVQRLLGVAPGKGMFHQGELGVFIHAWRDGAECLGEKFFAWEPVPDSKFGARLGRMLSPEEIRGIVAGQEFVNPVDGKPIPAVAQTILLKVERFREGAGK